MGMDYTCARGEVDTAKTVKAEDNNTTKAVDNVSGRINVKMQYATLRNMRCSGGYTLCYLCHKAL